MPGRDPEDRTRQLCNAWKSDNVVAAQVLSERTGRLAAQLAGYRGVRILQDNVLWKPPGTKAIGFHQDSSYADYLVPPEMITCWISLHETQADAGPIEFVRGSHALAEVAARALGVPRARRLARRAARCGARRHRARAVPVVVKPGGGSFHHGLTWHGSAPNPSGTVARMALVSHLLPVETRFHETNVDVTYSRYRRRGDLSLDESFFPVVWDESGYRTPWLAELPELDESTGRKLPRLSSVSRTSHGGTDSAARRASEARIPGDRAGLLRVVDRPLEAVLDRLLGVRARDPVLVGERVERLLVPHGEDEVLPRDAELARGAVERREGDLLERLVERRPGRASPAPRTDRRPASARTTPPPSARYGTTTAATSPSATSSGSARLTSSSSP